MRITAKMDPATVARFNREITAYQRELKKTQEEVMVDLGRAVAKSLANELQPVGLSARVGRRFENSIQAQVNRAIKNANVQGGSESPEQAHDRRRNSKGRVSRDLQTTGQYKRKPIEVSERLDLARRKAQNAGVAKGAWIAAGEALGGPRISGVGRWVRRHVRRGSAFIQTKLLGVEITLHNKTDHVQDVETRMSIRDTLDKAYKSQLRRMRIILSRHKKTI